jgi:hypothetical protein
MVALPCGSRSISSTRCFIAASEAARLTQVVVLPTPPFWFAIAITLVNVVPLAVLLRVDFALWLRDHHEMSLLIKAWHVQWKNRALRIILAQRVQLLGGQRPFHGQKAAARSQQMVAGLHHILQGRKRRLVTQSKPCAS